MNRVLPAWFSRTPVLQGRGAWSNTAGYVAFGTKFDAYLNAANYTFSFWYSARTGQSNVCPIGNEQYANAAGGFQILMATGGSVQLVTAGLTIDIGTDPDDAGWHHVLVSKRASDNKAFCWYDGTLSDAAGNVVAANQARNNRFDLYQAENARKFTGTVRAFQFGTSVVTNAQAIADYNALGELGQLPNIIAYVRGLGDSDRDWLDEVGSNDGTVSGTLIDIQGNTDPGV